MQLLGNELGVSLEGSFVEFGTSFDWILPPGALEGWLEVQAESIRRPAFRGLVTQLNLLLADLPWTYGDSVHLQTVKAHLGQAYGGGHQMDVVYEDLSRVPYEELRRFHDTYYRPNNTALILVGDVKPDTVLPIIEDAFGDWEPGRLPDPAMLTDERLAEPIKRVEVTAPTSEAVWVGWTLPPASDGSRPALEALASMLDGPHGLLRHSFADSVVLTEPWVMLHGRVLILGATPREQSSAAAVETELVEAIQRVASGALDDQSWGLASARWPLDAAAWDRARPDLIDRISTSFKLHREWSDVVVGISGEARPRAEIEAVATMVLGRDRIAMHVRPGPPWAPLEPGLPVDASWPVPQGPSEPGAFAAALAESPSALVEPRFLSEGMHFERSKWGDAEVITHASRGPLYWVDIGYPVGVQHDPYVCDAARYRARAWLDSGALPGVEIETWCTADTTNFTIIGVADSFEETWTELWKRLDDTALPPELVKERVASTLRERASARQVPYRVKLAMSTFVWPGQRGLQRSMPSDKALAAAAPARFEESLRRLAKTTPDIAFSGPDPAQLKTGLPEPRGPRPPSSVKPPVPLAEHTFYVLDVPEFDRSEARFLADWIDDTARDQLLADLYVRQPGPAFDDSRSMEAVAFSPVGGVNGLIRPGFTWAIGASHEGMVEMLDLALRDYVDGPPASRYASARARVETSYRHQRYRRIEVPRFVQTWSANSDPRLARWNELGRMKPEAFAEYALRMGKRPLSVALLCDVSKTDLRRLRALGRVVTVSLEEALRNVEERYVSPM